MIILGIDPGAKGGLAWVGARSNNVIDAIPMPMISYEGRKPQLDSVRFMEELSAHHADYVVLEWIQSRPRQSSVATFQQGRSFGAPEALVHLHFIQDRIIMAQPKHWKQELGVSKDKNFAVDRATAEFGRGAEALHWPKGPRGGNTIYDGIAEAALLALYGYRRLAKENKLG